MLEMTFILLISGPRVGSNITVAKKSKIEDLCELLIEKYFRLEHSFKQLKNASKQLNFLREDEIALLTKKPIDYYKAKRQDGFKFRTWGSEDEDEDTPNPNLLQINNTPSPTKLQLPFVKEE